MSPPLVLPFRGDQFSFTLNFKESSQDQSSVDFSAVVIGRDGKVLDVINKHKPSALDSAIVTSHDRDVWLDGTNEVFGTFADEAIHVRPKRLDPTAEVIVLVASVPYIPGQASDLSMNSKLEFIVSYPGRLKVSLSFLCTEGSSTIN
ncbi:hypothetical protein CEUSTIGMA_g11620.t1 [Chlamydomonas eustigma]|uniref:Uncharacterized protein n=1 Tax=Chlamydomonas eustigma TaxID=1157962 RepID=A0A250XMA3_9CHLO|nr:hypothetical protein CEUSTIGMA_g11620.t1 [Chlamydomonas eustigma]|eukprot:GAX84197.1 hypothetical protein CEUSTIGMA_g11620.t1 [Chlamydomonas eustigma]